MADIIRYTGNNQIIATLSNVYNTDACTYWYTYTEDVAINASGYTFYEYIESNGNCYLDTLVAATGEQSAEVMLSVPSTGDYTVLGARSGNSRRYMVHNYSGWCMGDGTTYKSSTTNFSINTKHLVITKYYINGTNLYCDNMTTMITSNVIPDLSYNYYLFAQNNAGSVANYAPSGTKIYYAKIFTDGEMVRYFMPAKRNSDNAIGMYDAVNGNFYQCSSTNKGTLSSTAVSSSVNIDGLYNDDNDYTSIDFSYYTSVTTKDSNTTTFKTAATLASGLIKPSCVISYVSTTPHWHHGGTNDVFGVSTVSSNKVIVAQNVERITTLDSVTTTYNSSEEITYSIYPTSAYYYSVLGNKPNITVSSANTSVTSPTVSNGTVTINGKGYGETTITLTLTGDSNAGALTKTIAVTVNKATGGVTTAPVAKSLVYGTNSAVASNGAGTGTMYYLLSTSSTTPDEDSLYTAASWVGGGSATYTSSASSVASTDLDVWMTTMPTTGGTVRNAGTYYLFYYAAESTNYTKSSVGCITITVQKANNTLTLASSSATIVYNQILATNITTNTSGGTITAISGDTGKVTVTSATSSAVSVQGVAVTTGTTITVTSAETTNYKSASATLTVVVNKATGSVTSAPVGKTGLTYNTSSQQLLSSAGTATGTLYYYVSTSTTAPSTSDSGWVTSLSSVVATNANTYYIYYYSAENDNYTATTVTTSTRVSVSIAKASNTLTLSNSALSLTYGTNGTITVSTNTSGGTISASSSNTSYVTVPTVTQSSITVHPVTVTSSAITVTVTSAATANYNSATKTVSVTVARKAQTITISPTSFTFNYGGSAQTFTLSANEVSNGSFIFNGTTVTSSASYSNDYLTISYDGTNYSITPKAYTSGNTITITTSQTTNYAAGSKTFTVIVNKVAATCTAPTKKTLTYTGSAQVLINAATNVVGGTAQYSLDNSTWTTDVSTITKTDANTSGYTVYWRISPDTNHTAISGTITVPIAKATNPMSISNQTGSVTFSTSSQTKAITTATSAQGTVTYAISSVTNNDDTATTTVGPSGITINSSTGVLTIPASQTAGTYKITITATAAGNDNYNSKTSTITYTLTVNKAAGSVTTVPVANSLSYGDTGNVASSGVGTGDMYYALTTSTTAPATSDYSKTMPTASGKDAGTYYLYYYTAASTNYNATTPTYITVTISKITQPFAITGTSVNYNSTTSALATISTAAVGSPSIYYSNGTELTASNCTTAGQTTIPTAGTNNAGTYTIYFYCTAVTNYNEKKGSVTATIKPITNPFVLAGKTVNYNTSSALASITTAAASGTTVYYAVNTQLTASNYTTSGSTSIPTASGRNAGSYTVYYYIPAVTNYNAKSGSVTATISAIKASGTFSVVSGLVYSGSEQTLVSVSSVVGGTAMYKLGTGSWTSTAPTASTAGNYTVYAYVAANSTGNYTNSDQVTLSPSIAKADCTITLNPTSLSIGYGGSAKTFAVTRTGDGAITATSGDTTVATVALATTTTTATADGTGTATYSVTPGNAGSTTITISVAAGTNYKAGTASLPVTVGKESALTSAPTLKTGLVYTGSAQELINAGSVKNGAIYYLVSTSSDTPTVTDVSGAGTEAATSFNKWMTAIPTQTIAADRKYYIWYKVIATDTANYQGVDATSIGYNTISRATGALSIVSKPTSVTYNSTATATISYTGDGTITATSSDTSYVTVSQSGTTLTLTGVAATTNNITITISMVEGTNYTAAASVSFTVTVAKANQTITIGTKSFTMNYIDNRGSGTGFTSFTVTSNVTAAQGFTFNGTTVTSSVNYTCDYCDIRYESGNNYAIAPNNCTTGYTITVIAPATANYNQASGTITVVVNKIAASFTTAPSAITGLTYTGSAQALINAPTGVTGGTIQYSTDGATTFSTSIPTKTNADEYTVYWEITPDSNHTGIDGSLTATIAKATNPITFTAQSGSVNFSTSSQTKAITAATNAQGTVTYSITGTTDGNGNATTTIGPSGITINSSTGVLTIPASQTAGTYKITIKATAAGNDNYNSGSSSQTYTLTINKIANTVTAPTANTLTYGTAASVATAGSSLTGELKYALATSISTPADSAFSTTMPSTTATTAAGTYYLYYYAPESTNYTASTKTYITITVNKKSITLTAPTGVSGLTYDNTAKTLINAGSSSISGAATFEYSTTSSSSGFSTTLPSETNAGTYTVYWKATCGGNYQTSSISSGSINVTISAASQTLSVTIPTTTYGDGSSYKITFTCNTGTAAEIYGRVSFNGTVVTTTTSYEDDYVSIRFNGTDYYVGAIAAGTSTISISVGAVTNYRAVTISKYAIVNKASQTFAITANAPTYGDTTALVSVTNAGQESPTVYYTVNTPITTEDELSGELIYAGNGSTSIPTASGRNAGTYTVYYWCDETTNYNSTTGSVTVTIAKKSAFKSNPTVTSSWTYDDATHQLLTAAGTVNNGTMYYYAVSSASTTVTDSTDGWSSDYTNLSAKNVGTYYIWVKVVASDTTNYSNYSSTRLSTTVTISKASVTPAAPAARTLTYSGTAQSLVTAGTTSGGTYKYCLTSSGTFTTTIPTGTNAGDYTVYWTFTADSNHTATTTSGSVAVSIAQASSFKSNPTLASSWTFDNTAHQLLTAAGTVNNGTMYYYAVNGTTTITDSTDGWSTDYSNLTNTNVGTYYIWIKVVASDTTNYSNYSATRIGSVTCTAKALTVTTSPQLAQDATEDGTAKSLLSTTAVASGGTVYYYASKSSTTPTSTPSGSSTTATALNTWITVAPKQSAAGTYYVWYSVIGGSNYSPTSIAATKIGRGTIYTVVINTTTTTTTTTSTTTTTTTTGTTTETTTDTTTASPDMLSWTGSDASISITGN